MPNGHLEQGVEIPKGAFDEVVGGHFRETHLEENLPELRSDFEERMKITAGGHDAQGVKVVRLEGLRPPRAVLEHLGRQISLGLGHNWKDWSSSEQFMKGATSTIYNNT